VARLNEITAWKGDPDPASKMTINPYTIQAAEEIIQIVIATASTKSGEFIRDL
jgi:hypothetical protein